MTPLSLFLLIIITAFQLEASVMQKTVHLVNEKKNWTDAQQYCKEKFTDLISGGGEHREYLMNEFVNDRPTNEKVWIGLYRDTDNASVWRWTGQRLVLF